MTGHEVRVPWRDTTVRAWLPDPIGARDVRISEATIRVTEQAAAAARAVGTRIPTGFEPLARLLLRAEGLASSNVEGVSAPITDVAIAEETGGAGTAGHVADNLGVVSDALEHAATTAPLTIDDLHRWHRQLMAAGSLPDRLVGTWRDDVGWIGGATPVAAVFVAAPHDSIGELMADLVDVANDPAWDPITAAAVVHAQFETVHPYGDGNGRIGRVLSLWLLSRHIDSVVVPPPMSVLIARDTDAYVAALGAFRLGMDDQLVRWFSTTLVMAGQASLEWAERLDALVRSWQERTETLRVDAAGRRLVNILGDHPVLSVETVTEALGVSGPAARNGLGALAELGILEDLGTIPSGPGRPRRWWAARELLDLAARWALP